MAATPWRLASAPSCSLLVLKNTSGPITTPPAFNWDRTAKASSISRSVLARSTCNCSPRSRAAARRLFKVVSALESDVGHGLPSEPVEPPYRTLRLPRKHRQVLGVDLNRSESSRREPAHERFDAIAGDGGLDGAVAERGSPKRSPGHAPAATGLASLRTAQPRRNPFTDALVWRFPTIGRSFPICRAPSPYV